MQVTPHAPSLLARPDGLERVQPDTDPDKIADLLRRDANYRRFLTTRMVMALGGMGSGFVTVAAVSRWQVPDKDAGLFTLALLSLGPINASRHPVAPAAPMSLST